MDFDKEGNVFQVTKKKKMNKRARQRAKEKQGMAVEEKA